MISDYNVITEGNIPATNRRKLSVVDWLYLKEKKIEFTTPYQRESPGHVLR